MRTLVTIHAALLVLTAAMFFLCGFIDKAKFSEASISHKPQLLFSHARLVAQDGGSVFWNSLIYRAHEGRRMIVRGDGQVITGFQGGSWSWKYSNLVWMSLVIIASLAGSFTTYTVCKRNTVRG